MPTEKLEDRARRALARDECAGETPAVAVRVEHPRVRPHVVAKSGKPGLAREDFVTSFLVVWQPLPEPPPLWIRFLKEAPFGTQLVRAENLHWDGKFLSIELLNEADIEAYVVEMPQWVEYANAELSQCSRSPAAVAFEEARQRAREIEDRLRRQ